MSERFAICTVPGTGGIGVLDRRTGKVHWRHMPRCCNYTDADAWRDCSESAQRIAQKLNDGERTILSFSWSEWRG